MAGYDELINVVKSYFYDATEEFSVPLLANSGSFSPEDRKELDDLLHKQNTIYLASLEGVQKIVSLLGDAKLNHEQLLDMCRKADLSMTSDNTLENGSDKVVAPTEAVANTVANGTAAPLEQSQQPVVENAPQGVSVAPEATVQEVKVSGENVALEGSDQVFPLSPIDEGVVSVKNMANAEITGAETALKNIQDSMSQVSADQTMSVEKKREMLQELHRLSQQAVRAIVVARLQLDRLRQSRDSQKQLVQGSFSNNSPADGTMVQENKPVEDATVQSQPAVTVQGNVDQTVPTIQSTPSSATVQPTSDGANKEQEMQTMLAQANQLYGQGKSDEAAQLLGQVTAMNRENQGTVYVKKPE